MLIDLIRHGEPVGGSKYRGSGIDDPLSEKGWEQMRTAVNGVCPWTRVVSSPLLRCREFAEELAVDQGLECCVEEAFKEIGFGEWEGKTKQQLSLERPEEFENFYIDPVKNTPGGAEPVNDFLARVATGIELSRSKWSEDHLLVVAHAGVIRAAIASAMVTGASSMYRIQVRNASLTRIEYSARGGALVFHDGLISESIK